MKLKSKIFTKKKENIYGNHKFHEKLIKKSNNKVKWTIK